MAFQQQRPKPLTQVILALAGLGAIAPGCIAFATGAPATPQMEVATGVEQPAIRSLKATVANAEFPFIGTRFVNFTGGTGTVESIAIAADGTTKVGLIGLHSSQLLYSGPYSNPILLNDGRGLRIEGDKVVQLFADEATIHRCHVKQSPCEAALQKPFAEGIRK